MKMRNCCSETYIVDILRSDAIDERFLSLFLLKTLTPCCLAILNEHVSGRGWQIMLGFSPLFDFERGKHGEERRSTHMLCRVASHCETIYFPGEASVVTLLLRIEPKRKTHRAWLVWLPPGVSLYLPDANVLFSACARPIKNIVNSLSFQHYSHIDSCNGFVFPSH
jgi:hypothetical protein